jgi:ATP phosphoribosyltransferase
VSVRIAVSKGRIFEEALPLLARCGIEPAGGRDDRRLILPTTRADVELVVIRAADVPTYVEHGAAELGIAGSDIIAEHPGDGLYAPLDLRIARCRMVVAGRAGAPPPAARARVATKYTAAARRHYACRGEQVELIKLYGSMELAPLVGLADYIVDLVDTGSTLRANGLVEIETLAEVSSRLVVNRAALKLRTAELRPLLGELAAAVGEADAPA